MSLKGLARLDRRTKDLVKRLLPGEIAIIDHQNLDEVAAQSLVSARVRAVINTTASLSKDYPNQGPLILVESGILLLDEVGDDLFNKVSEGEEIEIKGNGVFLKGECIAFGKVLTKEIIRHKMEEAKSKIGEIFSKFVKNTLKYAKHELELITGEVKIPRIKTSFKNRHALIVVRGHGYIEDLKAIKSYINEIKPVLIGVDGGADALREFGYRPDIIVGDMDSISDETLKMGSELIVHAYSNGKAPGLERVERLGLNASLFPSLGTSEDIAMLLAFEQGAELIVAVGTHSSMVDFLEKGRKGMASTFLVRLKVGPILVDAKGVSKLYKSPLKARYLAQIFLAALLPVIIIMITSPSIRQILRLIYIQFRLIFGI